MIAGKIARIINGDPNYVDSWHDIAGYATLIEQELKEKDANTTKEKVSKGSRINDNLTEAWKGLNSYQQR